MQHGSLTPKMTTFTIYKATHALVKDSGRLRLCDNTNKVDYYFVIHVVTQRYNAKHGPVDGVKLTKTARFGAHTLF